MEKDVSTRTKPVLFGAHLAKETNGASAASPVARAGVKKNAKPKKFAKKPAAASRKAPDSKESAQPVRGALLEVSCGRFLESLAQGDQKPEAGRRFSVVLLREGLGNLGMCCFYTADAIASAVPLFEGAQFYVDHASESEEVDRPERSVRDVAGYFENLKAQLAPDGCTELVGDLVIVSGPAFERERALMVESVEYSKRHAGKDLVGLSIHAEGEYQEVEANAFLAAYNVPAGALAKFQAAMQGGMQIVRPVQELDLARSCDLVTMAGAGGRINQLLERGSKMANKTKTADELKKEQKLKEAEDEKAKKEAADKKESEESVEESEEDAADGQDGSHPDAEQDMELIKGLLSKALGDGFSEDDHQMAREAYEKSKEMYPEDEKEAMKCAEHAIKLAKHMQAKQAGNPEGVPNPTAPKQESDKKESEKKPGGTKLVETIAENAALKAKLAKIELDQAIERGLQESKLDPKAKKMFKEHCLRGITTEKAFKEALDKFTESYASVDDDGGFMVNPEKQLGEDGEEGGISFADCKDDE